MSVLRVLATIIGSLFGILLLYLIRVIFLPFKNVKEIPIEGSGKLELDSNPESVRQEVSFDVEGDMVHAWLYMPEQVLEPVGCVIMSNGFGGTKGMILENYAMKYREAGYATLAYDYRHFGGSQGEPRQLFSVDKQYEDLQAAIDFARLIEGVDAKKIILWGTSAAGGYGLIKAAEDKAIAGVICQCPSLDAHADGEEAVKRLGAGYFFRMFMHAQRDKGRSRFDLSAHYMPIVGKEEDFAFINAPGAYEGYATLIDSTFVNEVCARAMFSRSKITPVEAAAEVTCPVLLKVCTKDNLVAERSYKEAADTLGDLADVKLYDCGHFDIYQGDDFEIGITDELAFLSELDS